MNEPAALASNPLGAPLAGAYLAGKLRELDARLERLEPRVLQPPSQQDPDACHDLRVALRRLRTVLEVGRKVLGPFQADEVRRSLRELMRATGDLRDEEVLLALVTSVGVDGADVAQWIAARRRREHAQRLALVRMVRTGQLRRGRALLAALLSFRVDPSRDRRLPKYARRAVGQAGKKADRLRDAPLDDATALHDLRIAIKRLRYTIEAFADVLPPDLAAQAARAAKLQKRLGDVHDLDVVAGCVRRARTLTPEGRTRLLEALGRLRATRIAAYARERSPGAGVARGATPAPPPDQAEGTVSLRKISTR